MEYVKLGRTPMEISRITFGCWEMGGAQWEFTDDENNIKAVNKALELGVTSFDTAEAYGNGHSEEVLGKALAGRRSEIVLATKAKPVNLKPDDLRRALQDSLKRLGTDYIDLYYLHWPSFEVPLEDTLNEMAKFKQEGLIRAIGLSNFGPKLLEQAMSITRIDAIQPEYSLLHRGIETEVLPWCIKNDVSVLSYSSIAKGILAGVFHIHGRKLDGDDFRAVRRLFSPEDIAKEAPLVHLVKEIADKNGISMSQVAIAWLLVREGMSSAIVGTQNERHLLDNLKAVGISLPAEDQKALEEMSTKVLMDMDGNLGIVAEVSLDNYRIKP